VIRRYPHRGLSRASRRISSRTSRSGLGRPGRRPGYVQRRATSPRCHASSVPGVTKNACQRSLGSSLLAAARNTRSAGRSAGRDTCRRSTAISWRRTTISSSPCSDARKHSNTSAIKRPNSTYSNDASTGPSPDRLSQRHYGLERPKGLWQRARSSLCTPHPLELRLLARRRRAEPRLPRRPSG
jgi:hypothetical protein